MVLASSENSHTPLLGYPTWGNKIRLNWDFYSHDHQIDPGCLCSGKQLKKGKSHLTLNLGTVQIPPLLGAKSSGAPKPYKPWHTEVTWPTQKCGFLDSTWEEYISCHHTAAWISPERWEGSKSCNRHKFSIAEAAQCGIGKQICRAGLVLFSDQLWQY